MDTKNLTRDDLKALPLGAVIRDCDGDRYEKEVRVNGLELFISAPTEADAWGFLTSYFPLRLDSLPGEVVEETRGGFRIGDRVRAGARTGRVVAFSPQSDDGVEVMMDDFTYSKRCSLVVPGAGTFSHQYLARVEEDKSKPGFPGFTGWSPVPDSEMVGAFIGDAEGYEGLPSGTVLRSVRRGVVLVVDGDLFMRPGFSDSGWLNLARFTARNEGFIVLAVGQ